MYQNRNNDSYRFRSQSLARHRLFSIEGYSEPLTCLELAAREVEYLYLLRAGKRPKDMAGIMGIEPESARRIGVRLARMVGVSGAFELQAWANRPEHRHFFEGRAVTSPDLPIRLLIVEHPPRCNCSLHSKAA